MTELVKVVLASGNHAVYQVKPGFVVREAFDALHCCLHLATRFDDVWFAWRSDWPHTLVPATPEQVRQFEALPISFREEDPIGPLDLEDQENG